MCPELPVLGIVYVFKGTDVVVLLHDSQYIANSLGEGDDTILFPGLFMDIDIG
jgi:hypothetical protein